MSADQRDLREHGFLKDLAADFRALRDECGDDAGIPNDDGSWMLASDIGAGQGDKPRARRFRDLATIAAGVAGIAPGTHPFDSWMMRLRDHPRYVPVDVAVATVPPYPHPLAGHNDDAVITESGWLNDVIQASSDLCRTLEADAVISQHAPFGAVVPVSADESWATTPEGRQTRVANFLQTLTESGVLTGQVRTHQKADEGPLHADEQLIWEAAGYATNTTWWRWKTHKQPPSLTADRRFRSVLNLKPREFMQAWTIRPNRARRV